MGRRHTDVLADDRARMEQPSPLLDTAQGRGGSTHRRRSGPSHLQVHVGSGSHSQLVRPHQQLSPLEAIGHTMT